MPTKPALPLSARKSPGKAIILAGQGSSPEHFRSQQVPGPPGRCSQSGYQSLGPCLPHFLIKLGRGKGAWPGSQGRVASRHPGGRLCSPFPSWAQGFLQPLPCTGSQLSSWGSGRGGTQPLAASLEALGPVHFLPLPGFPFYRPLCSWVASKAQGTIMKAELGLRLQRGSKSHSPLPTGLPLSLGTGLPEQAPLCPLPISFKPDFYSPNPQSFGQMGL